MVLAILEGSNVFESFSKKSLAEKKQWLENFVKKHMCFILITTNISREEWSIQLQTEAVKNELASKTNEALNNCFLMASDSCNAEDKTHKEKLGAITLSWLRNFFRVSFKFFSNACSANFLLIYTTCTFVYIHH